MAEEINRKNLIICDLDGTLLNTIHDLGESCNHALRELGFAVHPVAAYNFMVGNGVRKLMERAQPDATPEVIDELLERFREYYNEHCCDATRPYPGIPDLLKKLTESGVAVAVCSNKYQLAVSKIISHYFPEIPFVAVVGQTEGMPVKPDPSMVFDVLLKHPTPKQKVMMVGDSAVDIEAARRACVESVGVAWGFRPLSELRGAYADNIIYKPEELLKIVL